MKKLFSIILAALMLFTVLTACGGDDSSTDSGAAGGEDSSGITDPPPQINKETYAYRYYELTQIAETMAEKVNSLLDASNYEMEKEYPDDYYKKPGYTDYSFAVPFVSAQLSMTSAFGGELDNAKIQEALAVFFDECTVTSEKEGSYRVDFKVNGDGGYTGYFTADYELWTDSIKFEAFTDEGGTMHRTAFTEFVSLGDDKYAICDMDEQAVVTYVDGEIKAMSYSKNKIGVEGAANDHSWYNEPSIYPEVENISASWVEKDSSQLQTVINYSAGQMTVDVRTCKVTYKNSGAVDTVTWNWQDTIAVSDIAG